MLSIYKQYCDFHIFKKFKYLLGDWWNLDILIIIKNGDQFFYEDINRLNNPVVKSLLSTPLFKNYFLSSLDTVMNKKADSSLSPKLLPWKQTGLNLFVIPLALKPIPFKASLVAVGFAPKKEEILFQALQYQGLSKKNVEHQINSLKKLSQTDEVYVQKMLKILADEFFVLLSEKKKQTQLINKLNGKDTRKNYGLMVGKSPSMQYIFNALEKTKNYDSSVLIEGEAGTGKKLLAKSIHFQSSRSDKAFYIQNFSSIRGKLSELELFGCSQNAFPKMKKNKKALLEKINGGTLFLNGVEQISPHCQEKLLKFLKEGVFFYEGGEKAIKSDVRIISASNKNLKNLVSAGQFNKELYSAMSSITVKIPALKSRKEDIPLLVQHFLKNKSPLKTLDISPKLLDFFHSYSWPGNIRELENEIDRILSLHPEDQNVVSEENVSPHIQSASSSFSSLFHPGKQQSLRGALRSFEKQILQNYLRSNNWNKAKVARLLGTSRTSVILKAREYGLLKKEGA